MDLGVPPSGAMQPPSHSPEGSRGGPAPRHRGQNGDHLRKISRVERRHPDPLSEWPDGTDEVVEPYGLFPLKVIPHATRRRYATSLERGIREAVDHSGFHNPDALLILQADFTEAPEAIAGILRRFQSDADQEQEPGRLPEPPVLAGEDDGGEEGDDDGARGAGPDHGEGG